MITSSASTTPSAPPPPPRSQKFAGLPPAVTTTSTVDIASPRAVPEDPDTAIELDVDDALLAGERLERVGCGRVPELGDVGMAVERAVVDRELESSAFTTPSGVTMSGLISASIASHSTKQR